jgi:hypothetical protein
LHVFFDDETSGLEHQLAFMFPCCDFRLGLFGAPLKRQIVRIRIRFRLGVGFRLIVYIHAFFDSRLGAGWLTGYWRSFDGRGTHGPHCASNID